MPTAPFYLDWKFWSAVAAWIALTLTQLPPLRILFRRAKLVAETPSRISLFHKVGNPNAALNLILTNVGGRELRIREVSILVKRGTEEFLLTGQSYFRGKDLVLFSPFKLKPNEEWVYVVSFFQPFSRQDEQKYRQLESNLRQDINEKIAQIPPAQRGASLVTADDGNVQPLLEFFDEKFRWVPGEYEMFLRIKTEPQRASLNKHYRFILFESESKELRDHRDDIKHGFGVYIDSARTIFSVPFTEV